MQRGTCEHPCDEHGHTHAEPQTGDAQSVHVWMACRDHLARMTHAAFADWLEDHVWVQFPITAPMSDILSEVIDRLRQMPEDP
jgi:hypothetical protein